MRQIAPQIWLPEKGKYPTFEGSNWSRGVFPIDRAKREAINLVQRELNCDWETPKR